MRLKLGCFPFSRFQNALLRANVASGLRKLDASDRTQTLNVDKRYRSDWWSSHPIRNASPSFGTWCTMGYALLCYHECLTSRAHTYL